MKKSFIVKIISFLFIFLFIYAAASKFIDFQKFRVELGQSPLLTAMADWIAWIVPILEIFISALLAAQKFRLAGLYASFSLMVIFTAYIITITHFSEYIPCSCGGILATLTWNQHLIFNLAFVLLGIIGVLLSPMPTKLIFNKNLLQQYKEKEKPKT
ncbi:MAG TPA: MauE/DoxX family redox-associated membrane protein [Puia sp.]|nr:MauE/DoxX family redox-associated membrane protein [Puia sp.]